MMELAGSMMRTGGHDVDLLRDAIGRLGERGVAVAAGRQLSDVQGVVLCGAGRVTWTGIAAETCLDTSCRNATCSLTTPYIRYP